MKVLEEFIAINTQPATIERYLTDPKLVEQWFSPIISIEPVTGEWMAQGSIYRMRLVTLGLIAGATYTVAERDSSHIRLTADGFWHGTELWHWFADGARTIVQHRVEYQVANPVLRIFGEVIGAPFAQVDMRVQLVNLQQLIEGRRQVAQGPALAQLTAEKK